MSDLWEHPSKMLMWLEEEAAELFRLEIKEWLEDLRSHLEKENRKKEIYRIQGEILICTRVLSMQDDIRRLEEDKKTGKRRA